MLSLHTVQLVCIIVENEEDIAAFKDYQPPADEATPTPPPPPAQEAASQPPPPPPPPAATPSPPPPSTTTPPLAPAAARGTAGRVFASPYARTLAAEQGVDLQVGLFRSLAVVDLRNASVHAYA